MVRLICILRFSVFVENGVGELEGDYGGFLFWGRRKELREG